MGPITIYIYFIICTFFNYLNIKYIVENCKKLGAMAPLDSLMVWGTEPSDGFKDFFKSGHLKT